MNCLIKNFKELSVKQIRTYAAVIIMSALSFEATALIPLEEANPDPVMVAPLEAVYETELALESWMLYPFEVSIDEEPALEALTPAASEAVFEMELALESWMAMPFEISLSEESDLEIDTCSPAP